MTGWSTWLEQLAEDSPSPLRQLSAASPLVQGSIWRAVREGSWLVDWSHVEVRRGGHTAIYQVATTPLRLGVRGDEGFPTVSQRTSQAIADHLGFYVASAVVLDAIQDQAEIPMDVGGSRLPAGRADGAQGTDLIRWPNRPSAEAMAEESSRVIELAGGGLDALCGIAGKAWIPDAILWSLPTLEQRAAQSKWPYHGKQTAVNYGFPSVSAKSRPVTPIGRWRVHQRPGIAHTVSHTDYSQRGPRLVWPIAEVDGYPMSIEEVAISRELNQLWHYEGHPGGSLHPAYPRHPWLPRCGEGGGPAGPGASFAPTDAPEGCPYYSASPGVPLGPPPRLVDWGWVMMVTGTAAAFAAAQTKGWRSKGWNA